MTEFNSLTGLFFHTFMGGEIQYQGKVLKVVGDAAECQLYSWITGDANGVEVFSREFLQSDNVRLYDTHGKWIVAARWAP